MRLFSLLLTVFLFNTAPGVAEQASAPIRVVFPYIPLMAETAEHGLFIRMFQEVSARSNMEFSINILPPRRALQSFKQGDFDAIGVFPSLAEIPISLASVPYYRRENLIFYLTSRFSPGQIKQLSDLDGMQVGLSAYEYPAYIMDRKELDLERIPGDILLLRMIASGRLDAAIIEGYSGKYLQNILGMEHTISATTAAVTTENIFTLFKADLAGIANRKAFNLAIYEMLCDGTLAKLFGASDLLPDHKLVERDVPPSSINPDCNPVANIAIP